jgi:hypothetical protein
MESMCVDCSCGLWQFITSCSNHKTRCQKLTIAVPQNKAITCSAGRLQASPYLCAICTSAQLCDKHSVFVLDTLHSRMWNAAVESHKMQFKLCHSLSQHIKCICTFETLLLVRRSVGVLPTQAQTSNQTVQYRRFLL